MRPDRLRTATAAAGLAIVAMYLAGTLNPSAGINPLPVISNNPPWPFLVVPILTGAALLTAFAYVTMDEGCGRGRSAGCEDYREAGYDGSAPSVWFRSANRSPSRASTTLR